MSNNSTIINYAYGVVLWLALLPVPALVQATELGEALAECAAVVEAEARLRCYDRLAGKPQAIPSDDVHALQIDPVPAKPAAASSQETAVAGSIANAMQITKIGKRLLGIRPYKRNYILPVTYNDRVNHQPFDDAGDEFHPDETEIKFQLSAQLPVWENILDQQLDLYFGYTQLSFFQAYNSEYSAPFRDTSYEPELGLHWHPDLVFKDWRLESARIALNHQSNGRSEPFSRSWNRLIGEIQTSRGDFGLGLRVWKRLPENSDEDDNPDITHYMGHGELFTHYETGDHRFDLMLRNPKHPGMQLDWRYKLNDKVGLYVQYFNGYGESLLDYDHSVDRIGIGFLLNDWP